MSHKITLYSDGAASGNPGPGGFGVVLISGNHRKEISEGYKMTTNNRMELLAVIRGLEALKAGNCQVTVYTDSRYVADAVEKGWVFTWERKDFKGKKNTDLWRRFLRVYRKHQVQMVWIKGHASIPENERCDSLAVKASQGIDLLTDQGYIAG
jgi:ribonuclease HI